MSDLDDQKLDAWMEDQEPLSRGEARELIDDLYEEIMKEVKQMISPKSDKYYFNIHKNYFLEREKLISLLYDQLTSGGFVSDASIDDFKDVFSGDMIKDYHTSLKWNKAENLCVYLFDQLEDYQMVKDLNNKDKLGYLFGIKDASQKKHNYSQNKDGKPRGSNIIDAIIRNIQKGLE